MEGFTTVDNLKHCESKLRARLVTEGRAAVVADTVVMRRTLYTAMMEVRGATEVAAAEGRPPPLLRELNNTALNTARSMLLAPAPAPAASPSPVPAIALQASKATAQLERDSTLYGKRPVVYNTIVSQPCGGPAPDVSRAFEGAMNQRKEEQQNASGRAGAQDAARSTVQVDAIDADEFASRMRQLELERDEQMARNADVLPPPPGTEDPAAAAKIALRDQDDFRARTMMDSGSGAGDPRAPMAPAMVSLPAMPPVARVTIRERCIAINGGDRDWVAHPYRYTYTVPVAGHATDGSALHSAYRNVRWLQATTIILPMEIMPAVAADPRTGSKAFYHHEYSFAYPYLVLQIDGFDGVYDGTNDTLRRAFCVFVYLRSYKAPNGRGYVVLQPAQKGRKEFIGAPLASLRDLSMAVLKPNGTLMNNSVDNYGVARVEYDPTNRLYLRIVTDKFFDRNEFYQGDTVRLRGFESAASPGASPGTNAAYASLDMFLCRPEGHELVLTGPPNEQGFHRSFFILAPGVLDQGAGRVIVDAALIAAVQAMDPAAETVGGVVKSQGRLLNMSLQTAVTLRAGVEAGELQLPSHEMLGVGAPVADSSGRAPGEHRH